jgi:hypothetical protein
VFTILNICLKSVCGGGHSQWETDKGLESHLIHSYVLHGLVLGMISPDNRSGLQWTKYPFYFAIIIEGVVECMAA